MLLGVIPPRFFQVLGLPLMAVEFLICDGPMDLMDLLVSVWNADHIMWDDAVEQRVIHRVTLRMAHLHRTVSHRRPTRAPSENWHVLTSSGVTPRRHL